MSGGADISKCERYRYRLWRELSESHTCCLFIMLRRTK